eukprot:SAG22_NODE_13464_length_405_cov_2.019608_1_plen_72_part_10
MTDWHDADLHTVVVEAEMVVGARLQPEAINQRWVHIYSPEGHGYVDLQQAGEDETPAERDKLTPATYTVTIC